VPHLLPRLKRTISLNEKKELGNKNYNYELTNSLFLLRNRSQLQQLRGRYCWRPSGRHRCPICTIETILNRKSVLELLKVFDQYTQIYLPMTCINSNWNRPDCSYSLEQGIFVATWQINMCGNSCHRISRIISILTSLIEITVTVITTLAYWLNTNKCTLAS
jgi:hypothetical protein